MSGVCKYMYMYMYTCMLVNLYVWHDMFISVYSITLLDLEARPVTTLTLSLLLISLHVQWNPSIRTPLK